MNAPDPLETIRAGEPFSYAYDVYGTGRVWISITWDPATETFVEERREQDMGGQEFTGRTTIDEEVVRRHLRGAQG